MHAEGAPSAQPLSPRRRRPLPPWLRVADLAPNARIWIHGSGAAGRELARLCRDQRPDVRILGHVDARGEGPDDAPRVVTPEALPAARRPGDQVLVASAEWIEIVNRLRRAGTRDVAVACVPRRPGLRSAIVLEPLRALCVVVHKVACKSLHRALLDGLGEAIDDRARAAGRFQVVDLRDPRYRGWLRFAFVRNPWDRLVSCFEDKLVRPAAEGRADARYLGPVCELLSVDRPRFEDFARFVVEHPDEIADGHWRSQASSLLDADGSRLYDRLGRFETLEDDYAELARELGLAARLPRLNASSRRSRDHRGYYPAALAEQVAHRYAVDLEHFGYRF